MKQTCSRCGNPYDADDLFCTGCGQRIEHNFEAYTANIQKDKEKRSSINEPLSLGKCLFGILLLLIPVVNLICLLVWSFSRNSNTNAKNIARALLIAGVLGLAFIIFGITQFFFQFHSITSIPPSIEENIPVTPWQDLDLPFDVSRI